MNPHRSLLKRVTLPKINVKMNYVVVVLVVSALLNGSLVFASEVGSGNCSIGSVREQFNENEVLSNGGTYVLPDEVPCDGYLTEWRTCFFYNYEQNPPPVTFRMDVAVIRRQNCSNDRYALLTESLTTFSVEGTNTTGEWNCTMERLDHPFQVAMGDRIIVAIPRNCNSIGRMCPMQPNLHTSTENPVYFSNAHDQLSSDVNPFRLSRLTVVEDVHINLQAIIEPPASVPCTPGINSSIGSVREQFNENEVLNNGGVYVLPDEVTCGGYLTAWRTCFFYNYEQNPPPVTFILDVAVIRLQNAADRYAVLDESLTTLNVEGTNTTVEWNCIIERLDPPFQVAVGDRIIVAIPQSCGRINGETICPIQLNLNASTENSVLYSDVADRLSVDSFRLCRLATVEDVHLNLEAIIEQTAPTEEPPVSVTCTAGTTSLIGTVISLLNNENEILSSGGVYVLPDEAPCDGYLTEWRTCFFYNYEQNPPPVTFILDVGVIRQSASLSDRYVVLSESLTTLEIEGTNATVEWNCITEHLDHPFQVAVGDRIITAIPQSCSTISGRIECPMQPNLNTLTEDPVHHSNARDRLSVDSFRLSRLAIVEDVHVNLQAVVRLSVPPEVTGSPTFTSSLTDNESQTNLSEGKIAGVSVAVFAFVVIVLVLLLLVYGMIVRRRKQKGEYVPPSSDNNDLLTEYRLGGFTEEREVADTYAEPFDSKKYEGEDAEVSAKNHDRARFRKRKYSQDNHYSIVGPAEDEISITESVQYSTPDEVLPLPQEVLPSDVTILENPGAGHYEFANSYDYEDPYWEPASMEDELKLQLLRLKVHEIPKEQLQICEHLGRGQFGTVNRGLWQSPEGEREVAVKSLAAGSTEDGRVKFLQEAAIMGQFKHPNVLSIYGVVTLLEPKGDALLGLPGCLPYMVYKYVSVQSVMEQFKSPNVLSIYGVVTLLEPLMILCEMMHKGDLRHHLQSLNPSSGSSLPPELPAMLLSYCRQVAAGMAYLASKTFIHRDLAARNILVSRDEVCMIADFGLSRLLAEEDFYVSHGGKVPVKWTAPEAVQYRKYSSASDVWSYGILLYEIWALGTKPYHTFTNTEALQKILTGYRLPPPPGCPREIYQLMVQCWHPEPESRPTFFDVLLALQRPDFQLLRWAPEDVTSCTRTLGGPIEDGKGLYQTLQGTYNTITNQT